MTDSRLILPLVGMKWELMDTLRNLRLKSITKTSPRTTRKTTRKMTKMVIKLKNSIKMSTNKLIIVIRG